MASTQPNKKEHPIQKPQRAAEPKAPASKTPDTETSNVRNHLAVMTVALLIMLALVASVQTGALPVLQFLSPIIGAIFGFYFGRTTKSQ